LTCLRRRIELPFAAPLPLGETFGLVPRVDLADGLPPWIALAYPR
jgi:hypothetical protein